ncbi:MAG: GYD domain-containing protein [Chloroflexi bacterium]|nr:GYD domain-containing protein [Chloroflexota bacterium]
MPTYVTLGRFTEQGIRNVKQSPDRVNRARAAIEQLGGRMTLFVYTQGQYDFVSVADFPDEASAMSFLLSIGAQGNVRTETLRAFTPEEMQGFVAKLP